jgi:hypothetical protein
MDARRGTEWKVSFGIWTALGAFAGLAFRGGHKLPLPALIFVSVLLLAVGSLYTFIWTRGLRERQLRNLKTAHFFLDLGEDGLGIKSPRKTATIPGKTIFTSWAHATQTVLHRGSS